MSLMKVVQGRLQLETTSINLARVEGEVLDALAAVVEEGGMLGDNSRTHTYNGTLQLDREARTVLLRCGTKTNIINLRTSFYVVYQNSCTAKKCN